MFNRATRDPKDHWMDAACVGETGAAVHISEGFRPILTKATGHGIQQVVRTNRCCFHNAQELGWASSAGSRQTD
ncbi:hypothetical protein [Methylocaldum szegediense]|nr:hypothetical protein [Methylocaldum szegediense]